MAAASRRFRRADRVLTSREYREVAHRGLRSSSREFVLLWMADDEGKRARLGLTVSRKVGNAVARNQIKRWVREWFRGGARTPLVSGRLVVIARHAAVELQGAQLGRLLDRQLREVSS